MRIMPAAIVNPLHSVSRGNSMLQIELNQAYHTGWSSPTAR
jgi:hypothetical protein